MKPGNRTVVIFAFLLGVLSSGWLSHLVERPPAAAFAREDPVTRSDNSALQADVQQLKDKACDQAHAMISVAYNANNMWFAAEAENWPLTQFYWNETRSHLRWAVRIIPIRKDNAGNEVNLPNILEAFENSPLSQLQEAIAAEDHEKFVEGYRFMLENCYACHKAADKPYLRPQIPEAPDESTINFDPDATWPR